MKPCNTVTSIEQFLDRFIAWSDPMYRFPLALWIIGTHMFESFAAYAYLCITSTTKQSGKTRMAELAALMVNNPLFTSGATAASLFRRMALSEDDRKKGRTLPTMFCDEAEARASGTADTMRAFLNSGYRKGQVVPRVDQDYPSYCPKVFILIGDLYDTLRDRCIVINCARGNPPERYVPARVESEVAGIREHIAGIVATYRAQIEAVYVSHNGLPFLSDRDEELWLPLFCIAQVLCPDRIEELSRNAVDIATEKTADRKVHFDLEIEEADANDRTYAERLLMDLHGLLQHRRRMSTDEAIEALKALPTAPWRKFRGTGLDAQTMGYLLKRYGLKSKPMRFGKKLSRGYWLAPVEVAAATLGGTR